MEPVAKPPAMDTHDLRAALGYSHNILTSLLPKDVPVEAPQEPQNAPEQEQTPQGGDDLKQMESRIMDEISGLRDELKNTTKDDGSKEIKDLKKQIEAVLNETE